MTEESTPADADREARGEIETPAKRKPAEATPIPVKAGSWRLVFESAAVAVACAVYLAEVFRRAMTLYGF